MFKLYECGCIGFVTNGMATEPGAKEIHCFKACDSGDREYAIHRRDTLQEKPSRKLTDAEICLLFAELGNLVDSGNALNELRCAMNVAGLR